MTDEQIDKLWYEHGHDVQEFARAILAQSQDALDARRYDEMSREQLHGHAPGTHEAEMAENARRGIQHRIDYLHDSLRRMIDAARKS